MKRILLVFIIISLLGGSAVHAGQRIGTRRALLTVAEEISYLVRATFTATDQGYSDDQVVDDPSEGIEDGQLTIVEDDGSLAIVSNKCAFTAQDTPTWGDLGFYSQGITRALGRGLLSAITVDTSNTRATSAWADVAGIALGDFIFDYYFSVGSIRIIVRSLAGVGLEDANVATYSGSTDYQLAIVLGGADSNGVPWRQGENPADYLYGADFYIRGGMFTTWTKLWKTAEVSVTTLYAAFNNYNAAGTVDNFRVPDIDLSAVLQPTCLSTFTADDGTSLDAITPEVGGAWTEQSGDFEIQSNRAVVLGIANAVTTVDAEVANALVDGVFLDTTTHDSGVGLAFRVLDSDNYWSAIIRTDHDDLRIIEWVAAGATTRADTNLTIDTNTDYSIRVVADGQQIDCFLDGGNKTSYDSASNFETETKHGVILTHTTQRADNIAIYPRTSSVYDATLNVTY